jgi:hypothetical protein
MLVGQSFFSENFSAEMDLLQALVLTTLFLPPGVILAPGVNLAPRGELCHLGVLFTPSFTPRDEQYVMFRRTEGQTEGLHPWVITSPLGDA